MEMFVKMVTATFLVVLAYILCNVIAVALVELLITIFG